MLCFLVMCYKVTTIVDADANILSFFYCDFSDNVRQLRQKRLTAVKSVANRSENVKNIYVELDVDTDNYNAFFWGRDDQDHEASNKLEDMLMKHNYNPELALELEWEANDGKMYTLGSSIQNGKLLIPVGSGIKWLNNYHANLNIWCMKGGEKVDLPEIKKIEFYSLRDIEVDENKK